MVAGASVVAGIGLLVVYLGLTYLGATMSQFFDITVDRTYLVTSIVQGLLGGRGHHPVRRGGGSGLPDHRGGAGEFLLGLLYRPEQGADFLPGDGVPAVPVQRGGVQLWHQ